jgi:UDP-N-acetylmuramoylalanine--D-glutamate ligase
VNWDGQKVLIIGAARQGTALARYLVSHGADVTLNDQSAEEELTEAATALSGLPIRWVYGGHPLWLLDDVDLVCVSGGVPLVSPLVQEAVRRGIPLSNDSQIFLEVAPCPVIGITGSAGKTTTTALVGQIAREALVETSLDAHSHNGSDQGAQAWVGGNIGWPLIAAADDMGPADLVVMELSSFQLELMTRAPQLAAVLNVTPNHLDRHNTMESYTAAKARILTHQGPEDLAVLGHEDPGAWSLRPLVQGDLATFGFHPPPENISGTYLCHDEICVRTENDEHRIMPLGEISLRGMHNRLNVLAACAISLSAGLPDTAVQRGIGTFSGLPHRLEYIRTWQGAEWYNDSIATAPERAIAALRSFTEPIILLVGGRDKDLPWGELISIVRQRVDHLIVFGEAADLILEVLGHIGPGTRPTTVHQSKDLKQAVERAAKIVEPGDVVLLSPGGTSFDEFRDFEERGEVFRQWVMELT